MPIASGARASGKGLETTRGCLARTTRLFASPTGNPTERATDFMIYEDGTYLENTGGSWHAEDSPWKAGNILDLLEGNGLAPESVAEIGCGAGEILRCMHAALPRAEFDGWDISPQAYEICKAKKGERLCFHLGDLLETEAYYDVVIAADVFEHVPDYHGFLRKLQRRARYKVLHIPLDMSVLNVLRGQPLRLRKQVGHLHYFDAPTALATLEDCGYRISSYRYTAGSLDLERTTWRSRLARIPRQTLRRLSPRVAAQLLGGFSLLVLAE